MRFRSTAAALIVASGLAASCGGLVDPSNNVTEPPFTNTLKAGGGSAGIHTFNVSKNGEFSAQFVSLTPPLPQVSFCTGILLAPVVSGQCLAGQPFDRNDCATPGKQALPRLTNGVITSGLYCLVVFDESVYPTDETYTVTVSHP